MPTPAPKMTSDIKCLSKITRLAAIMIAARIQSQRNMRALSYLASQILMLKNNAKPAVAWPEGLDVMLYLNENQ